MLDTLVLYMHHTCHVDPPAQAFAETALICSRRGDKSRALAFITVFLAQMQDITRTWRRANIACSSPATSPRQRGTGDQVVRPIS